MIRSHKLLSIALLAGMAAAPALAQFGGTPPTQPSQFHDTSMLKPPAGSKVAIWKFEDLECPACARAYPIVHELSMKYHIPVVRKDFPLKMHVWSHDAAIYARYMQDKLPNGPNIADQYRSAVFANQMMITSKDDLFKATQKFLADRKFPMPFVIDPQGELAKEVDADYALGERINITQTPTIWVVTDHAFQQVTDYDEIDRMLQAAMASTKSTVASAKK